MPLLKLSKVAAGYGSVPVILDIDMEVGEGEVVALVGPNGAGKTTTLNVIGGYVASTSGSIEFRQAPVPNAPHQRAKSGLAYVNENRSVLRSLTTRENLKVARVDPGQCLALFPELRPRLGLKAGDLSGGEQQMLAVGRALARQPALLMADELSLGLAPLATERVLKAVREAAGAHGVGVLLVEQHLDNISRYADRVYLMVSGRIAFTGPPKELMSSQSEVVRAYFGQEELPHGKVGE